jgi:hypothetical protein
MVLSEAQRQFILRRLAQRCPPPFLQSDFNAQWSEPKLDLLTIAKFDPDQGAFLNPIDGKFFDEAREAAKVNPNLTEWTDRTVQAIGFGWFVRDAMKRHDYSRFVSAIQNINELFEGGGGDSDSVTVDKITRTIIDPTPIEEPS